VNTATFQLHCGKVRAKNICLINTPLAHIGWAAAINPSAMLQ
jgi:hypothetical protein